MNSVIFESSFSHDHGGWSLTENRKQKKIVVAYNRGFETAFDSEKQNGLESGRYERADLFCQLFCPGLELSVIKTVSSGSKSRILHIE